MPGESLSADAFILEAGGKGFNIAVGARRLGANVDGLFAVGDDIFSSLAERALERSDLPLGMLRRFSGPTGAGIGFTDARGENCLAVYPGANAKLSASDVRGVAHRIRQAKIVLAQFEIGSDPIAEAFTEAKKTGGITILNPSPYRDTTKEILQETTILIVNRVEAGFMAEQRGIDGEINGLHPPSTCLRQLAEALFDEGLETLIVTLGAEGAVAWRRETPPIFQQPFPVLVVDTLGAGDAFTAGLAIGLLTGQPLTESLRLGAKCGALATMQLGVFDALPKPEQVWI